MLAKEKHNNKKNILSTKEKDDRKAVLKSIEESAYNLRFASEKLQDDEEVVRYAVAKQGLVIEFASDRLKDDFITAIIATKQNGLALAFLSNKLTASEEVVLTAVKQNGNALAYANKELKDNEEIVLNAVKNAPLSLKFASKRIRDMKKYIFMTLEQEVKFDFMGIDKKWFSDPVFMFEGVKICKKLLSKFDKAYLNQDIAIMYVKRDGLLLEYLQDYADNYEVVKMAVSQNGMALKFASKDLRDNIEIVFTALAKDIEASYYIGDKMRLLLSELPLRYPSHL